MDILFIRCTKEVENQKRLASLLADWRRDGDDPVVHDTVYLCKYVEWSRSRPVNNRRFWTPEHNFEMRFSMLYKVLVG